jgi:hypothetical protein
MSRLPETGPSLRRIIEQERRRVGRTENSSAFARSGSSVTGEDVTEVAGTLQSAGFDGDLDAGDAGTTGWAMNAARVAIGELFLRPGSVGNDALTSPVVPAAFYAPASNFAVPNAWTTVLEHSLTTPAGFTQAVVIATAWARIQNTSGAVASSYGTLASINGVAGPWDDDRAIPINYFGNLQATYATLVTGLTEGETVPIRTRVFSSPALSADPDNEATINGVVLWLR